VSVRIDVLIIAFSIRLWAGAVTAVTGSHWNEVPIPLELVRDSSSRAGARICDT